METRKIVKSGNTSYIMALPITWVRAHGLEHGKSVGVTENEHGDLVVFAKEKERQPKEKIATIRVDGKSMDALHLEFLDAYIRDAVTIIFEGREILAKTGKILEQIRLFIGVDVIEQSTKNIVIKNFFMLDRETSPHPLIKKMDIVNRACMEMLFSGDGFDREDSSELEKLHAQNGRLFILTRKSILKLLEHPGLMREIQTTTVQLTKERILAQSLIGVSHTVVAAGNILLFLDTRNKMVKQFLSDFLRFYNDYCGLLNDVYNKSVVNVRSFLIQYPERVESLESFLKTVHDPLLVQGVCSLLLLYSSLRALAYEALV